MEVVVEILSVRARTMNEDDQGLATPGSSLSTTKDAMGFQARSFALNDNAPSFTHFQGFGVE